MRWLLAMEDLLHDAPLTPKLPMHVSLKTRCASTRRSELRPELVLYGLRFTKLLLL